MQLKRYYHMKKHLGLIAALCLTACTAIPVKTLYKLATTDPLQVDPMVLRAAVRAPTWLEPRADGVNLSVGMTYKEEQPVTETFVLQSIPVALEGKALQNEGRAGFDLYAFRLNPQDIPRLQAFREQFKAHKAQGKTQGSLAVSVNGCRKSALPDGEIPVTTYLKLEAEGDYLPLLVDYDLRKTSKEQDVAALIPACTP